VQSDWRKPAISRSRRVWRHRTLSCAAGWWHVRCKAQGPAVLADHSRRGLLVELTTMVTGRSAGAVQPGPSSIRSRSQGPAGASRRWRARGILKRGCRSASKACTAETPDGGQTSARHQLGLVGRAGCWSGRTGDGHTPGPEGAHAGRAAVAAGHEVPNRSWSPLRPCP